MGFQDTRFLLLLLILPISLPILTGFPFATAQGGTNVSGIISQDTTWTKAGSPYTLTGPVAINQDVTLNIEGGATINLGPYYIEINGALRANQIDVEPKGDPSNNANITFTSTSIGWNEQTSSGSIIQNSNLGTVCVQSASPKIIGSTIHTLIINGGQPTVAGNNILFDYQNSHNIASLIVQSGEPSIYNNSIGLAEIRGGSPIISKNVFGPLTTISTYIFGGSPTILNNIINGETDIDAGSPTISNNTVAGQILHDQYGRAVYMHNGIEISGGNNILIDDNMILADFSTGIYFTVGEPTGELTIQRNLIKVNGNGIVIDSGAPTIQNNTIASCYDGILTKTPQIDLTYNNIENNSDYNLNFEATGQLNATSNWWGTTDTQAINQTIYDFKNNFNLGTVTFVPFLTSPNSQAPIGPTPTPSPSPSSPVSATTTPAVPELSWLMTVPLLLFVFSVVVIVIVKRLKR